MLEWPFGEQAVGAIPGGGIFAGAGGIGANPSNQAPPGAPGHWISSEHGDCCCPLQWG